VVDPRPTLETVASRAEVSRQTVSNVINAPHLVRPETIERVRAVIEELGYRPHGAARQLRTRRSQVIGLRVTPTHDGINGAVLDRFLHSLTEQAQVRGYRVMLFTAPDDDGEIAQYDELLDTVEIDAFVLTSTHHDDARTRWLAEHEVPFVTFGRPWDQSGAPAQHAWVDVDGQAGTRAAVEHLASLGHRTIAYVGWPEGSDTGDDRRRGWRRAMRELGVGDAELDALDVGVPDGIPHGAAAARRLMDLVSPTAVVCASDSLALGVLSATGADLGSPTRLAVVGFDDTPVARAVGLSSIAQPLTEAAGRTLDLLLEQLAGRRTPDPAAERAVLLAPHLVTRASSTPRAR
jgi:DNA-binding LacI/PurR family transcriptional regulator